MLVQLTMLPWLIELGIARLCARYDSIWLALTQTWPRCAGKTRESARKSSRSEWRGIPQMFTQLFPSATKKMPSDNLRFQTKISLFRRKNHPLHPGEFEATYDPGFHQWHTGGSPVKNHGLLQTPEITGFNQVYIDIGWCSNKLTFKSNRQLAFL